MSAEKRKILLLFWTSLENLPFKGFTGLEDRLQIWKLEEFSHRLPTSQTCFYRLYLPPYPSMVVMQDRMAIITQDFASCSFGIN